MFTSLDGIPSSNTLSEVFLDDNAWSKAQFSPNTTAPKKSTEAQNVEESNGQIIQTTSLTNGTETTDDKKALSKFD